MHQGPPPGCEKEDDSEDEDEDDYAVRQPIRPRNNGVSDSILASLHLSNLCKFPSSPIFLARMQPKGRQEEGELSSAFLNLTTEPHQEDLGEGAQ